MFPPNNAAPLPDPSSPIIEPRVVDLGKVLCIIHNEDARICHRVKLSHFFEGVRWPFALTLGRINFTRLENHIRSRDIYRPNHPNLPRVSIFYVHWSGVGEDDWEFREISTRRDGELAVERLLLEIKKGREGAGADPPEMHFYVTRPWCKPSRKAGKAVTRWST